MALALEQLHIHPKNAYLISMITRTFIELIESKSLEAPTLYVPTYTHYYDDQLKLVKLSSQPGNARNGRGGLPFSE